MDNNYEDLTKYFNKNLYSNNTKYIYMSLQSFAFFQNNILET